MIHPSVCVSATGYMKKHTHTHIVGTALLESCPSVPRGNSMTSDSLYPSENLPCAPARLLHQSPGLRHEHTHRTYINVLALPDVSVDACSCCMSRAADSDGCRKNCLFITLYRMCIKGIMCNLDTRRLSLSGHIDATGFPGVILWVGDQTQ